MTFFVNNTIRGSYLSLKVVICDFLKKWQPEVLIDLNPYELLIIITATHKVLITHSGHAE